MNPDDETTQVLERLRTAYHKVPPSYREPVAYRIRRRGAGLRSVMVLAGGAAFVTALVVAVGMAGSPSGSDGGVTEEPGITTSPSSSADAPPATRPGVADALYRILDMDPDLPGFMLGVDATGDHVDFYSTSPSADLVRELTDEARAFGYGLDVHPFPEASPLQDSATSEAANLMRSRVEEAPAFGFTTLKVQPALDSVVLWHTTDDPEVEQALADIAESAGVTVEMHVAPMSREATDRLATRLRAQNDRWAQVGFEVLGAYPTGSGAVVLVSGDVDSADRLLGSKQGVIAVLDGTVTPDSGAR